MSGERKDAEWCDGDGANSRPWTGFGIARAGGRNAGAFNGGLRLVGTAPPSFAAGGLSKRNPGGTGGSRLAAVGGGPVFCAT